jgi:mutator protein MutT
MGEQVEVAAGIIERDGLILIAQRLPHGHLGLLWEFPGGKREPGETLEECLEREILEELGIQVEVGQKRREIEHIYPDRTVQLTFFSCRWKEGEPRAIGCHDFRWVPPNDLKQFQFPDADKEILVLLST